MRSALTNPVLVGRGYCADVFEWGPGRVLKLFHASLGRAAAEREFAATRAVHAAGLPVAEAEALTEVDGRWGIIFERIDGPSMVTAVEARPWTLLAAARQLADLHYQIHQSRAPDDLPLQRNRIAAKIDIAPGLTAIEKKSARLRLDALPDGTRLCHGDFHPGNVLLSRRGPVVIDWSGATRGDPLGDVAITARLIRTARLPPWSSRTTRWLVACTRRLLLRTYRERYRRLTGGGHAAVDAWDEPIAAAAVAWRLLEQIAEPDRP